MADATQLLSISVEGADARGTGAGATASTIVPDPAAEYRFRAPDEALLRSIATATGGAYHPTPAVTGQRDRRQPDGPPSALAGTDRAGARPVVLRLAAAKDPGVRAAVTQR